MNKSWILAMAVLLGLSAAAFGTQNNDRLPLVNQTIANGDRYEGEAVDGIRKGFGTLRGKP